MLKDAMYDLLTGSTARGYRSHPRGVKCPWPVGLRMGSAVCLAHDPGNEDLFEDHRIGPTLGCRPRCPPRGLIHASCGESPHSSSRWARNLDRRLAGVPIHSDDPDSVRQDRVEGVDEVLRAAIEATDSQDDGHRGGRPGKPHVDNNF